MASRLKNSAACVLFAVLLICGGAGAQEHEPPSGAIAPPDNIGIGRQETDSERRDREESMTTFDGQGRLRSQPDQLRSQPALTIDRLQRSQNPSYGVGPGVNIIRRQP